MNIYTYNHSNVKCILGHKFALLLLWFLYSKYDVLEYIAEVICIRIQKA